MAERGRVGRWTRRFGGRGAFGEEIGLAAEIQAEWTRDGNQRDVVFGELPGWLSPLWGSDGDWLYLRRPEGIWKARIPAGFDDDQSTFVHLYAKSSKRLGGGRLVGMEIIGRAASGQAGWIRGAATGRPMDAAEMDARALPSSRGIEVEADAVGAWGGLAYVEGRRIVVDAGDHFAEPPAFRIEGDWLMASEAGPEGRTVAFPMQGALSYAKEIGEGRLWLRFGGKWLPSFEAKVSLSR